MRVFTRYFFNQREINEKIIKKYIEQYNKENPNYTITLDEAKELLAEKCGKLEEQK